MPNKSEQIPISASAQVISLIRNERKPRVGVSLSKRRTWYADGDDEPSGSGKYNPQSLEDAMKIIGALEKRVGEREATNTTLEGRLAALEAAQKKKLEDEGNYKALLDQASSEAAALKPYQARAAALEDVIRKGNETLIQRIPETSRAMAAELADKLSPEAMRDWLDKFSPQLVKPPPPNFEAGAGSGSGSSGSREIELTADEKVLAVATGMTPEQYATAKAATVKK
jgi:hypothetical protein